MFSADVSLDDGHPGMRKVSLHLWHYGLHDVGENGVGGQSIGNENDHGSVLGW